MTRQKLAELMHLGIQMLEISLQSRYFKEGSPAVATLQEAYTENETIVKDMKGNRNGILTFTDSHIVQYNEAIIRRCSEILELPELQQ